MPGRACSRIAPLREECAHTMKYVVLFARYQGRWVFCRHKERSTWEMPGGHIDPGETPLEAAKRELYEEAGIRDADVEPLFDYWAYDGSDSAWGQVFLAEAHSLQDIPGDFEMAERRLCDAFPPPEELTYAYIGAVLFPAMEKMIKGESPF